MEGWCQTFILWSVSAEKLSGFIKDLPNKTVDPAVELRRAGTDTAESKHHAGPKAEEMGVQDTQTSRDV